MISTRRLWDYHRLGSFFRCSASDIEMSFANCCFSKKRLCAFRLQHMYEERFAGRALNQGWTGSAQSGLGSSLIELGALNHGRTVNLGVSRFCLKNSAFCLQLSEGKSVFAASPCFVSARNSRFDFTNDSKNLNSINVFYEVRELHDRNLIRFVKYVLK